MTSAGIDRVREAIERVRQGQIVILVDDEDRENEGDLCMAAQAVTPEAINFMAKFGRGLICLALEPSKVERLGLPMMVTDNRSRFGTAFTVSIEARCGVSTGISAADRATTILAAVSPDALPSDIVSPGHVFPLRAASGGVLQRSGQTEGSVDLARLAGLEPAGVICEVMKDDGTMARMPDLEAFARGHGLSICTIADIIEYRLQTEKLVRRAAETRLRVQRDGVDAEFQAIAYVPVEGVAEGEFLALVHGDPAATEEAVLCRVHTGSCLEDVLGVQSQRRAVPMAQALRAMVSEEAAVLLYVPSRTRLVDELGQATRESACAPGEAGGHLREFGLGAQILRDLGVRRIRLMTNNPRKIVGLAAYGLEIADRVPLVDPT